MSDEELEGNKEPELSAYLIKSKHICPCKFDTVEDALADMDRLISEGKIIKYFKIK